MILSTHAIVGASTAIILPTNPPLALALGFVSHFLLDMIPHYDYKISSIIKSDEKAMTFIDKTRRRALAIDIAKVLFDILVGCAVVLLVFNFESVSITNVAFAMFGALLPDGLSFLFMTGKFPILNKLQTMHEKIHAKLKVTKPTVGLSLQALLVFFVVVVALGAF